MICQQKKWQFPLLLFPKTRDSTRHQIDLSKSNIQLDMFFENMKTLSMTVFERRPNIRRYRPISLVTHDIFLGTSRFSLFGVETTDSHGFCGRETWLKPDYADSQKIVGRSKRGEKFAEFYPCSIILLPLYVTGDILTVSRWLLNRCGWESLTLSILHYFHGTMRGSLLGVFRLRSAS